MSSYLFPGKQSWKTVMKQGDEKGDGTGKEKGNETGKENNQNIMEKVMTQGQENW